MISGRLLRAYRQTRYCADGVVVRIGHRSAAMDAVLAQYHARAGAFITAWNPHSRRMPEGWNRLMQARLRSRLRRRAVLAAGGSLGRWHEDHLLVLGSPACVERLARQFRQNALVTVRTGAPSRLRLITANSKL